MAKKLPKETQEIIAKYGLTQADVWDCHGTWVIYHKSLERIAAQNGITFSFPDVICNDIANKQVALIVRGEIWKEEDTVPSATEWSIGEAAPYNSKNSYPFAMAEKRAKDRVILKLLGLHGDFYSEEEAEEFQPPAERKMSMNQINKNGTWDVIMERLGRFTTSDDLEHLDEYKADLRVEAKQWPQSFSLQVKEALDEKKQELEAMKQLQMQGVAAQ